VQQREIAREKNVRPRRGGMPDVTQAVRRLALTRVGNLR
jgi:hypothetical protein